MLVCSCKYVFSAASMHFAATKFFSCKSRIVVVTCSQGTHSYRQWFETSQVHTEVWTCVNSSAISRCLCNSNNNGFWWCLLLSSIPLQLGRGSFRTLLNDLRFPLIFFGQKTLHTLHVRLDSWRRKRKVQEANLWLGVSENRKHFDLTWSNV